jgi:uncharacterized protein with HEPN domain
VSSRDWKQRVQDILDAIIAIQTYTEGLTFESFAADRRTIDAVMHNITVIGEAANHVPNDVVAACPAVPWDKMRAIRNVVVHMYFGVRKEILWQTVREDLPPLVPRLEGLLSGER